MGISPEDIREACGYKGRMQCANSRRAEDEWPWGWELTPGIVSVWAEADGRAVVWRRIAETDDPAEACPTCFGQSTSVWPLSPGGRMGVARTIGFPIHAFRVSASCLVGSQWKSPFVYR